MRFLKVFGIAGIVLLFSFSNVFADAADDLLRALGELPPETAAPAETVASSTQSASPVQGSTTPAAPMTEAERNSAIDSLRAFIITLTQQLQEILAKRASQAQAAAEAQAKAAEDARFKPEKCKPITRTLSRGMKGDDVRCLQAVLVADKLLTEENATGFFGALTEQSVKQFQIEIGILSVTGSVGPKTMSEVNLFITLLADAAANAGASSTPETLGVAGVSFGPQLPVGVLPEDFVILSGEKNDYALRIVADESGAFSYTIDWNDGVVETGVIRSGAFKTVSHTFAPGVYDVKVEARNEKYAGDGTFVIGVSSEGGGGELLEIVSPQAAFKFDVVTLMPVTVHAKDARINGSVRLYLQESATARYGTGHFLGEVAVSAEDGTAKFPLTELKAGTYWLQAVGTRFQDCSAACKEYLPNHTVGPIQITDETNFAASQIPAVVSTSTATTTAQQ